MSLSLPMFELIMSLTYYYKKERHFASQKINVNGVAHHPYVCH